MLEQANDTWTYREAKHLLNRAGFGGSPGEVHALHGRGRHGAVKWLVEPGESPETPPMPSWAEPEHFLAEMRENLKLRSEGRRKQVGMSPAEAAMAKKKLRKEFAKDWKDQGRQGREWWFRKMLKTEAPLREKMTLFWHDHFATSMRKVKRPELMMVQNRLFRENAIGGFKVLAQAIVRDPAMMLYLDTNKSDKTEPNENFAREVMELFTLGEGNYTELDVKEAARAFTGYRLNRYDGSVMQVERRWDPGEKTIFGESGRFNGTDVISLILKQEKCAGFIGAKLWRYFVSDQVDSLLEAKLGEILLQSGYEVKPLLETIFLSREFYSDAAMGTQIKCPVQYLVQMLKELEVTEPPLGFPLIGQVQLGQILFAPPNVAGWDWGKAWINTSTLLARYNLAGSLVNGTRSMGRTGRAFGQKGRSAGNNYGLSVINHGEIAGESVGEEPAVLVDELIARFFTVDIQKKTRESFMRYAEGMAEVDFNDKEVGELCHLMMSTPYYQLC